MCVTRDEDRVYTQHGADMSSSSSSVGSAAAAVCVVAVGTAALVVYAYPEFFTGVRPFSCHLFANTGNKH